MSQVSDYNIANASGASVRADLNAVFSAIKTLNSGGSDPSNTEAFMPYVDTADSNTLKIRNAANNAFVNVGSVNQPNLGLLPVSGGTMTGALTLPNQSAGTPSINFGDSSTGIFRRGSNQIGFTFSGTEKIFADQNGLTLMNRSDVRFSESSGNGVNYVALQAPASVANNLTFNLPGLDGSNGQVLKTDGNGNLSFTTVTTFSGAASALTGNTLASGVTASSLTSVGTLGSLTVSGNIAANGNINGDGSTNISSINQVAATTHKATRFRSNDSSSPVFQNSSGTETAAGRLVRACVEFDSFRGGNASDNFASIQGQFNVSSITDHSEGLFSANFTTAVPSNATTSALIDIDRFTFNNHCVIYLENTSGAGTSSVKVRITSPSNSTHVLDKNSVNIAVFA
jgi:hypothetical protein